MKYTFFYAIILLFLAFSCKKNTPPVVPAASLTSEIPQSPFVGFYDWEQSSDKNSFNITIAQWKDSLYCCYCASLRGGAKLDCNSLSDGQPKCSFVVPIPTGNTFETPFKNYLTGTTGKVKMILYGGDIQWKVVEEPQGEYYAFRNALMKRSTPK
jgi:hypothetical protein